MANYTNRRGPPFPRGNKFGKGRPKIPDDIKLLRKKCEWELVSFGCRMVFEEPIKSFKKLLERAKDETMTPAQYALIKITRDVIERGDVERFRFLCDLLLGPRKPSHDEDNPHPNTVVFKTVDMTYEQWKEARRSGIAIPVDPEAG